LADTFSSLGQFVWKRRLTCCVEVQSCLLWVLWLVYCIQLFQLRLFHEQSGKVEYERERLLGIVNKWINLLVIPSRLSRSYSTFPLCSWTTLIEIAVYHNWTYIVKCIFSNSRSSDFAWIKAIFAWVVKIGDTSPLKH
jgi:hypothetical protein